MGLTSLAAHFPAPLKLRPMSYVVNAATPHPSRPPAPHSTPTPSQSGSRAAATSQLSTRAVQGGSRSVSKSSPPGFRLAPPGFRLAPPGFRLVAHWFLIGRNHWFPIGSDMVSDWWFPIGGAGFRLGVSDWTAWFPIGRSTGHAVTCAKYPISKGTQREPRR